MKNLITNDKEKINFESFSSELAKKIYGKYDLKEVERFLINKYFTNKKGKILDIGCGYGRTTKPLFDMGYDVVGIDIVPKMIGDAKKENPQIDFRIMSATSLDFPDSYFDYAIFSFNGIDYIYPESRRFEALKEIYRVLKPGGLFVLSSHNKASYFFRIFSEPNLYNIAVFLRNIFNGRIFTNYILARHEEGDLLGYAKTPYWQEKDFKRFGFRLVDIKGKNYKNRLIINFFEGWPYFVLIK
jgi:SAM-dependent methyltransferase